MENPLHSQYSRASTGGDSVAMSPVSPLAASRVASVKGGGKPPPDAGGASDSNNANEVPWHTLATPEDVYATAETTPTGLSEAEAARRRGIYGLNQMSVRGKRTMLQKIWDQVNSIIMYILLVSAVVSGAFQDWKEFALILLVVIVNVVIGESSRIAAAEGSVWRMRLRTDMKDSGPQLGWMVSLHEGGSSGPASKHEGSLDATYRRCRQQVHKWRCDSCAKHHSALLSCSA